MRRGVHVPTARRLLLCLLAAGCAEGTEGNGTPSAAEERPQPAQGHAAPAHFPITVADDAGREWTFGAPPQRIVSLVPSATAALLALDAGDRLVGRTDYDRDANLADLPSVGGGLQPSLERLVRLEPDLVVRFEGESDLATPRGLDAAGIVHFAVRPDTIGDVRRIVSALSRILAAPERGDSLLAEMDRELRSVREAVDGAPRPRVAILLGGDPPWVAGAGTFLHELVEIAGGRNVFADTGPLYAPVSVEEVLRREPDLLLVTEGSRVPTGLRALSTRRAPDGIQRPGPGVGASARVIARLLHPDRLP